MDNLNYDSEQLSEDQQNQMLFMMLIQQHQQIAMMGMGKVKNPATDEVERDLKSAKFAIDTLMMIQSFTEGNLPEELEDYLEDTLNNLRLNYADEIEEEDEDSGEDDTAESAENDEKN
jgi:hypothetical protein